MNWLKRLFGIEVFDIPDDAPVIPLKPWTPEIPLAAPKQKPKDEITLKR